MLAVRLSAPFMITVGDPIPFKVMSWAEATVKFCKGIAVEKAFGTRTSPVPAVIVKEWAPSMSVPKAIFPLFELRARSPVRLVGPEKLMLLPLVVNVPPMLVVPNPVWVNGPLREIAREGRTVKAEEFVIARGPPPDVVTLPLRTNEAPLRVMPEAPVVAKAPLKVARPETPSMSITDALMALEVKFVQSTTLNVESGADPPIIPPMLIDPVPPSSSRLFAPLTVFERVMAPMSPPIFRSEGPVKLIGPVNEIWLPCIWMLVSRDTVPVPFCTKFPARIFVVGLCRVSRPELLIVREPLFVVVTGASNVKAVPVRLIPAGSVVVKAPLNVVVPLPAFWEMNPAEIA